MEILGQVAPQLQWNWNEDARKVAQMSIAEQDWMRDAIKHFKDWSPAKQEAMTGIFVAILDQARGK